MLNKIIKNIPSYYLWLGKIANRHILKVTMGFTYYFLFVGIWYQYFLVAFGACIFLFILMAARENIEE